MIKHLLTTLLFIFSLTSAFAQSSMGAEIVSYQTFGEGLMVTKAKIPPISGLVSNFFFYNRADQPWNGNVWYEYDWEIRGAHPNNGWSQIRVRPQAGVALKNAPVNVGTTINIGNSLLHWILIRKGDDYIYDIRKDFDINTYNYNNANAHGGNSVSLLTAGPRVYTTGGNVADIPQGKQLDFSLGVTAFDNNWAGALPNNSHSGDMVIDYTRFYTFSGNNLNTTPQWQDEFNNGSLDYGKWQVANWSFGATQFTPNNIRFEDGKIILTNNRNSTNGGNSNTNLALNGTASQSSTRHGGSANRAIDNNTNGNWSNSSVTHTANATNSWWQVDLGGDSDINRIEIFNRNNCCSDRLSNFSVSVLDANDKVVWTRFFANHPNPSLNINLKASGRKVRVNLDGTLSLAEVRVFGTGGNTAGSSDKVVHIRKRNAAGFAIDGKGGAANDQNVHLWSQSTNNINQQWVEIDRGGGYFTYRKQDTNHCLDGGNGGAKNQNVRLWSCDDNNQNQHWQKASAGSGYYKLIKRNAAFAIDGGNGGANGRNVKLWTASSPHQNLHWQISEIANIDPRSSDLLSQNYFQIQKEMGHKVELSWQVNNKLSPIQFEIEYKRENENFETIEIVAADADYAGAYNYTHEAASFGDNTYRIKAVYSGYEEEYLEPKTVNFEENLNTLTFPNPTEGELFFNLTEYLDQEVEIKLADLSGKVLLTKVLDKNHSELFNLNISMFDNGFYVLSIKSEKYRAVVEKILLLRTY